MEIAITKATTNNFIGVKIDFEVLSIGLTSDFFIVFEVETLFCVEAEVEAEVVTMAVVVVEVVATTSPMFDGA